MNKKCLFIYFCFVLVILPVCSFALGEESLTVFYTSSLNGNLDGCDCKGNPRSGLVKTGYFLSRRDMTGSILLEAGDFLDVREDELLAGYIFDSFRELEYTVVGVGDQEFSNGVESLIEYGMMNTLLCNNISVKKDEAFELFSPLPKIVTRGKLDIGIFAVIDPDVFYFYPPEVTDNITIEDPVEAAEALVAELEQSDVDLIIGIYHGPISKAEDFVRTTGGIDLLLVGHEQRLLEPEKIGDTIIVSPGENGNRVGELTLEIKRNKIQSYENVFINFDYKAAPDLPSVRSRINEYYAKLTGRLHDSKKE